ncbi:MAG: hypothetical protein FJ095_04940 [Deltaproteobacteria bacterium]|nr:hypothetical protein [Deltaproteobacteria bacterium]
MTGVKRRLPVVQPREDEGEPRPPWQWSVLGAVATLLAFVPLAFGVMALARRTHSAYIQGSDAAEVQRAVAAMTASQRLWLGIVTVLGPFAALATSSFAGGLLVGRFGGEAGKKEAAVGGFMAACIASAIAASQLVSQPGGLAVWFLTSGVLFTVGGVAAYFGGLLGVRLRRSA